MSNKKIAVLIVAGFLFLLILGNLIPNLMPKPEPNLAPSRPDLPGILSCVDCEAEGIPANIFASPARTELSCQTQWGNEVAISQYLTDPDLYYVTLPDNDCHGWISKNLVQATE